MPPIDVTDDLHAAVLAAMKEATDTEVMPRWRALTAGEVRTKSAEWDVVTDADVLAERRLTLALRTLLDIPVVGEEATAAQPDLVDLVTGTDACWLVDPVDGTKNFVEGREDFACMVALVVGGRTQAAWITHPAVGRSMWGARGLGVFIDGERTTAPTPSDPAHPSGAIGARLFVEDADALYERAHSLGPVQDIRFCAGWDYYDLLVGAKDYVLFSRSLPWDHAPGGLLVHEAGLRIGRFNGDEYLPGDGRKGLLTAHPTVWELVRDGLGSG
jgi:fructose-1,6-bisphosphatase/inositol monophosphatase family enzyme